VTATLTLSVPASGADFSTLDTGAAWGALQGRAVSARALPAGFAPDAIDGTLLRGTVDANTTDSYMLEQATQLGQDPLKEFAYVQSLGYGSYKGSLRGTRGTLWSQAGNALDKASLLIAMLRASGIPSRYRHGTLDQAHARQLILSMFPASTRTVGYVPPGAPTADPANDPNLLAETQDHWWVEAYLPGQGWQDLDPSCAGATVGQSVVPPGSVATDGTDRIAEVPDATRSKVTVGVKVESYSPLNFDDNGLSYSYPLTHTFNSVELAGQPLSLHHLVSQTSAGFPFSFSQTTYIPYFDLNEHGVAGQPFQDVNGLLAFANSKTTAEWLEFDEQSPDGTITHYEHTITDTIGVANRQEGNVAVGPSSTDQPVITTNDVVMMLFVPGMVSPTAVVDQIPLLRQSQQAVSSRLAALNAAPDNTAAQRSAAGVLASAESDAVTTLSFLQAMAFYGTYDAAVSLLGTRLATHYYAASPRLVIVSSANDTPTLNIEMNVLNNANNALRAEEGRTRRWWLSLRPTCSPGR